MSLVVDCSVVTASCPGEDLPKTDRVLALFRTAVIQNKILVPALWPTEFANALLMAERRGRIPGAERQVAYAEGFQLGPSVEPPPAEADLDRITALVVRHRLTIYDAL